MSREQKTAVAVAAITLIAILVVTVFRSGTSW
jgi:hypothetical protein